MSTIKIADHNVALLQYHEAHPEVSNSRLGKLFGKSRERVRQIIKRDKRDRMVVEYFRTHPETTPAEVSSIFHISLQQAHSLSDVPMCSNITTVGTMTYKIR
ncbi:hypothetical protein ES705_28959 [subsurface metagenome]